MKLYLLIPFFLAGSTTFAMEVKALIEQSQSTLAALKNKQMPHDVIALITLYELQIQLQLHLTNKSLQDSATEAVTKTCIEQLHSVHGTIALTLLGSINKKNSD